MKNDDLFPKHLAFKADGEMCFKSLGPCTEDNTIHSKYDHLIFGQSNSCTSAGQPQPMFEHRLKKWSISWFKAIAELYWLKFRIFILKAMQ